MGVAIGYEKPKFVLRNTRILRKRTCLLECGKIFPVGSLYSRWGGASR